MTFSEIVNAGHYYIKSARPNGGWVGFLCYKSAEAKADYDLKTYGKNNPIFRYGKEVFKARTFQSTN